MYSGWVFVDVDGTLIDTNDSPRPYIKELFEGLKALNLVLVVWSGGGKEYAEKQVTKLGEEIYNLVDEFRWKGTPVSWTHIRPVFFIDDSEFIEQEHTVDGSRVFRLPFYNAVTAKNDQWLLSALSNAQIFFHFYHKGGLKKLLDTVYIEDIAYIGDADVTITAGEIKKDSIV